MNELYYTGKLVRRKLGGKFTSGMLKTSAVFWAEIPNFCLSGSCPLCR